MDELILVELCALCSDRTGAVFSFFWLKPVVYT